ncbi:MAG: helicase C-terminal domain-containing protein, partial [Fibrobacterota bacterium]
LWASRAFFSTEGLVASAAFADLMVGGKVDRNHLEERTEQLAEWLPWKRTVWRIKQFFNDKLFADIRSQVLNRENMNDSDSALLRKSSPFQRAASYAYSVSSNVSTSGQQYVKKRFNSPLWPDVLVTTDIMREGVDLHLFCDRMMHYGLAWSTGDLEQRNGRCDRCNSRLERELKNTTDEEKILNAYPIRFPFVSRTVDEKQVGKILEEIRNVDQSYILKHKKRTTAEANQTNAAAAYPKPEESIRAYEKFIESAREEIEEKHKLCKQMRALLTPAKSRCFPQVSVVTNTRNRITQVENMLTGLFGQLEPFTDGWKIAMKGDRVQLSALPELGNGSQSIYMTAKPIVSNGTVQLVLVLRSRLEPLQQYKTDTAMCLQRNAEELHPGTQLSLDSNDILWAQKSLYLGQTLHETSEDFRCCLKAAELHHSLTDIAGFITKKEDYKKSTAEVKPTWERVDRVLPGNCENNLMRFKLIVNNNQWLCLSLPIRTDLVGDEHRDIWRLNHRFPEVEFRVIEGNSSVCYFHPLTDNEEDLKEEELRFMMDSVLRAAQLIDSDHAITQEEEA